MATHKSTKTATAKAVEEQAAPAATPSFMNEEMWSQFMQDHAIKHPWLGLLAQIGTIAIGFSASIIIASTIANLILVGSTSMFMVGLGLALYYFISFIGCILSFRAASFVGDYVANGKFEEHYQDAKSWVKGLFGSNDVAPATVH
jgi:hypothetical protein